MEAEKMQYCVLYQNIMDNMCNHIIQRFDAVKKFEFFQLLCSENYLQFKNEFPRDLLEKLRDVYGTTFCYSRLQSQLEVLYSLSDFAEKSLHQTYEYLYKNGLINLSMKCINYAKLY